MKLFKSFALLAAVAIAAGAFVSGCVTAPATPDAQQIAAIKSACAIDAGLRPTITDLAVFITPDQQKALALAEPAIDTVCANPSGSLETNTLAIFSESTAQVVAIVATLQHQKTKSVATAAAPAVTASVAAK